MSGECGICENPIEGDVFECDECRGEFCEACFDLELCMCLRCADEEEGLEGDDEVDLLPGASEL